MPVTQIARILAVMAALAATACAPVFADQQPVGLGRVAFGTSTSVAQK